MNAQLERVERQIGLSLAVWGAASIAAGTALQVLADGERTKAFGRQTSAWGGVDLAIAGIAHLRARRRDRALGDDDRKRLNRILVVNAVLDLGYVAGGASMFSQADRIAAGWPKPGAYTGDQLRGDGAAVMVQGAFLLVHDSVFAARTR